MTKLETCLNEFSIYVNNSDPDEKVILILCSIKHSNILERANEINKKITGEDVLVSTIEKDVYVFNLNNMNKFKDVFKNNKHSSTIFIYNRRHIMCKEEFDLLLEETNNMYNIVNYEDIGDEE